MTRNPFRFTSIDWVRVPGRGDLAVGLSDRDRPQGAAFLIGTTIDIDGASYIVTSVEAPYLTGPIRQNEQVALWVQPHFEAQLPNTDQTGDA